MTIPFPAPPRSSRRNMSQAAAFISAVAAAAIASIALSALVAAIAHGAGAAHDFKALDITTYAPLILIGLLAATIAWTIARNHANHPARLMSWLAPAVVAASLIPDVAVGATNSLAGTSWTAVTALMIMHLLVAACGIASLRHFLPLDQRRR